MHLWIFVTGWHASQMVWIFCLAINSMALLGVSWWGVFSSHKGSCYVHHGWHLSISVIFFLYKVCRPTPLNFRKVLRYPLRPWGFPFNFLCPNILEEALKLSENFMSISARAGGFIPSNPLGALRSYHQISELIRTLLYCAVIVGFLSLGSLCGGGYKVLGDNPLQVQAMYQEVISLPSVFVVM